MNTSNVSNNNVEVVVVEKTTTVAEPSVEKTVTVIEEVEVKEVKAVEEKTEQN